MPVAALFDTVSIVALKLPPTCWMPMPLLSLTVLDAPVDGWKTTWPLESQRPLHPGLPPAQFLSSDTPLNVTVNVAGNRATAAPPDPLSCTRVVPNAWLTPPL